jgi:hypothetical protein
LIPGVNALVRVEASALAAGVILGGTTYRVGLVLPT